jgi:hypothetical protein
MNIDHFIPSELKVIASDTLDVSKDLEKTQTHSISELLNNEKKETKEETSDEIKDQENIQS